jgi:hypothetical protein
VKSICIPRSVESLGESCFEEAKIETLTFESGSQLREIEKECFDGCELTSVRIPRLVEVLSEGCFEFCRNLETFTFEPESMLRRIERFSLNDCPLKAISIPSHVEFIDGSAFSGVCFDSISVDPGNQRFSTNRDLLVDVIDWIAIRHFGVGTEVEIWKVVKVLGQFCFSSAKIEILTFENGSELTRIEEACFLHCSLRSIQIPASVEVIKESSFDGRVFIDYAGKLNRRKAQTLICGWRTEDPWDDFEQ